MKGGRNIPVSNSAWKQERGRRCFPVCTVAAAGGDINRSLHTILFCIYKLHVWIRILILIQFGFRSTTLINTKLLQDDFASIRTNAHLIAQSLSIYSRWVLRSKDQFDKKYYFKVILPFNTKYRYLLNDLD